MTNGEKITNMVVDGLNLLPDAATTLGTMVIFSQTGAVSDGFLTAGAAALSTFMHDHGQNMLVSALIGNSPELGKKIASGVTVHGCAAACRFVPTAAALHTIAPPELTVPGALVVLAVGGLSRFASERYAESEMAKQTT